MHRVFAKNQDNRPACDSTADDQRNLKTACGKAKTDAEDQAIDPAGGLRLIRDRNGAVIGLWQTRSSREGPDDEIEAFVMTLLDILHAGEGIGKARHRPSPAHQNAPANQTRPYSDNTKD
ncbi:hypothetical protein ACELLULO517_18250 [Acidisoma cellulosilytica]|uniref:Uncharacterized protein n=1 Tax=Acidisoma cellulosilyticum TaxID=2802395 RepID=A0A964E570_9PROT|nr:hypothetical protein [Acidisoma cellulosilyticum]MCB8882194.1 hypothetical protein [Acidisoma cellulosilyticum]